MIQTFIEQIILSPQTFWELNSLHDVLKLFVVYFGFVAALGRKTFRTNVSIFIFVGIFSFFCGLTPLLTILFINVAALAIGMILLKRPTDTFFNLLLTVFCGFASILFTLTFLVYFDINYQIFYILALALPIYLKRENLFELFTKTKKTFSTPIELKTFDYISLHSLFFILLVQVVYAAAPEKGFDALTTHLMLPTHINFNHSIQIDFKKFVPLLMPAGADWVYTLGYVLGGETAAKLVNFNFYILILISLFYLGSQFLEKRVAFLACVLFASTPLTGLESVTMFIENALTYFFLMSVLIVVDKSSDLSIQKRSILLSVALGITAQIKLFGFLFYPIMFPMYLLFVEKKYRFSKYTLLLAPILALAIASPPYIYAYVVSGNPIFPFFNALFKSPYFPNENFTNILYLKPFDLLTPFTMTFQSSSFLESHNGAFGIQNILFPLAFLVPFIIRQRQLIIMSVVCLVYVILVFTQQRYLRYIYPIMPITGLLMLCWASSSTFQKKFSQVVFLFIVGLNLYLFPTALWFLRQFPINELSQSRSKQLNVIPIRKAIEIINLTHGSSAKVLLFGDPFSTGLEGKFDTITWYSPQLLNDFSKIKSSEALKEVITNGNYTHILSSNPNGYPQLRDIIPFMDTTFPNRLNVYGTTLYIVKDDK